MLLVIDRHVLIRGSRMRTLLNQSNQGAIPKIFSVIPTMDVVIFPRIIVPLLVLDKKVIKGIDQSLKSSKMVLLLAAKNNVDSQGGIGTTDLHQVGTIASIMRIIKIPEGGIKILVQGVQKARVLEMLTKDEIKQNPQFFQNLAFLKE